ncbi:EamA family transporter [bacterium AH-315-E10]|nr:EamA family transporter [bacterium AH-315-E10]
MTFMVIIIVLFSALIHSFWNLMGKKYSPSSTFFLISAMSGIIVLLPVLIFYWNHVINIPGNIWLILVGAGVFQALYFYGLSTGYRHGDLSIVYPIGRFLPVIMVMIIHYALGNGRELSVFLIIGSCLAGVGAFLLPLKNWTSVSYKDYINPCFFFILLMALGTTGYTIVDDIGVRSLKALWSDLSVISVSFIYLGLESISTFLFLACVVVIQKNERDIIKNKLKPILKPGLLAGVFILLAYGLILTVYPLVDNVSYVVAFRQISIPIGALLGIVVLKESCPKVKCLGIILIFTGMMLIGF